MAKATFTYTRIIIVSIILSVVFGYSIHRCLAAYSAFEMETSRLTIAKNKAREAKEQRKRVDQYNTAMATLATFTSQVRLFGLAPEQWQSYDVSVSKSLTLTDTGNILDQLSHDKTYYFIPARLFIGTGAYSKDPSLATTATGEESATPPASANTADRETESTDITFSVQGKFMVRDNR